MTKKYGTKCITVVDGGIFVNHALTLAKDFGQVNYWSPWNGPFPKSNFTLPGYGYKEIKRINNLFDAIDETDIFYFPEVMGDGDLQLHLESLGKLVWGCRKGEEMEISREDFKEHMKELGLPVGNYEVVVGIDNLRKYLKEHKNVYLKTDLYRGDFETMHSETYELSEPMIDEMEYKLGAKKTIYKWIVDDALDNRVEIASDLFTVDGKYPQSYLCGVEVKDLGYIGIIGNEKTLPPQITDFNVAMSKTFKDYGYKGWFGTEFRVGKDKKSYMVDLCCFSEDTEILTDKGWKLFKDLDKTERVATLDSNGYLKYQKPIDYIAYPYEGEMVHLTNRRKSFDCLVTPNHSILRTDRNKKILFKQRADSLTDKGYIPRTAKWVGNYEEFFILPSYHKEWNFVNNWNRYFNRKTKEVVKIDREPYIICNKTKDCPELKIPMELWAEFMGWFLSEGSSSSGYNVDIAQTKYVKEIDDLLSKLPFKYNYNGNAFRISSVQLATYLTKYGHCNKKYIPYYIKNAPPNIIRIFLDSFNLGDGSIHRGIKVYYTSSKDLADGIQELLLKVNSIGNIIFEKSKGTIATIRGKKYVRKFDKYVIHERNNFMDYWFEAGCRKKLYINNINYNANVYCVTVPNGTLFVRRNGKPTWSGNCRGGSPPSELNLLMCKNIAEIVWEGANGNVVEPITEHKWGVEALIHSQWATKNWQAISFPGKHKDNVKLRNSCVIEGKTYIVPQISEVVEVGAIVAEDDTLEGAVEQLREIADQVKGFYLEIKIESLETAYEYMEKLDEYGIKLFD